MHGAEDDGMKTNGGDRSRYPMVQCHMLSEIQGTTEFADCESATLEDPQEHVIGLIEVLHIGITKLGNALVM